MSVSRCLTAAKAKAEVEKLPQIGDVYEFEYSFDDYNDKIITVERLIVVDVTAEHVMYKMPGVSVNKIFQMTHEVWKENTDERRKVEPVPAPMFEDVLHAAPELPTLDLIICPICEARHQNYEVKLLGSGIGNDKAKWSEWRCLLTGETWTHIEPVPAPEVT